LKEVEWEGRGRRETQVLTAASTKMTLLGFAPHTLNKSKPAILVKTFLASHGLDPWCKRKKKVLL